MRGIHSFSNCGKWKRLTGKSTKTSNIDIHHRRMSIFKETHILNVAFAETAFCVTLPSADTGRKLPPKERDEKQS